MSSNNDTFPNVGVRLDFFDRMLKDVRMRTPMRLLPIVVKDPRDGTKKIMRKAPERIDDGKELRRWGRYYRVFSHLSGDEEFKRYDGKIHVDDEEWRNALERPPVTTTQVNTCIIQPDTFEVGTSYCEMLRSRGETDMIGVPTCFLSHAWQYNFKNLVAAVKSHFARHRSERQDVVVWNDIFSEEQNSLISKGKDYFYNAFKDAIESIGYTLLVLDPWDNPIPFTRSWCIWELYSTITTGAKLRIAMPQHSAREFHDTLTHDLQTIAKRMSAINARKAEAFFSETKERIDRTIETTCGFTEVNKIIGNKMRKWLAETGRQVLEEEKKLKGEELSCSENLIINLALLFDTLGDLNTAETLLKRALRVREEVFGAFSTQTLLVVEHLGTIFYQQGRLKESHELLGRTMAICEKNFGSEHKITLISKQNFARLVRYEGNLEQAESLMRDVLKARTKILGPDHVDTLKTANSLGRVLRYQDKQNEAVNLLRDTVKRRQQILGFRHHETVASMNNLAGCLSEMEGESLEAEKMFKHVIRILTQTLGDDHRTTINAQGNLGIVYLKRGDDSDHKTGRRMVEKSLRQLLSPPHNFSDKQSWVRKFRKALVGDLNRRMSLLSSPHPSIPVLSSAVSRVSLSSFSSTASTKLERLDLHDHIPSSLPSSSSSSSKERDDGASP